MSWITNPDDSVPDQPGMPSPLAFGPGILAAGASIYDTYQRSKDVKNQIAAQKEEAELAYQRSVAMWHMMNLYNSPAEQMKRFGAAGLNPHLIYGQGSSGLASGTPEYHPPRIQMQGASPPYGSAIMTVLPTLMSVGTWMQNMRMSEVEIQRRQTDTEKMDQLIGFLREKNPREIERLDNALAMAPYQQSLLDAQKKKAWQEWEQLIEEGRHKYGVLGDGGHIGLRALERMQAAARARLTSAQAEWFEPATIMKLVLGGVIGMATGAGRIGQLGRAATRSKRFVPKRIITRFDSKGRRVYQRQE